MEKMSFEMYLMLGLFLSGFAKLIPVFKEWGNVKVQKIEVIISFGMFIAFLIYQSTLFTTMTSQVLRVFIGLIFFILFLTFILLHVWNLALSKSQQAMFGYLISPLINIIMVLGGIYILLINYI